MRFLSAKDLLIIHAKIVDETGGSHGVRDVGLLLSSVHRPQATFSGKAMYRTIFDKAAAFFESIALNHAFVDGNKRTAFVATVKFLSDYGYKFRSTNLDAEIFVLSVVADRVPMKEIAKWFRTHTKKSARAVKSHSVRR